MVSKFEPRGLANSEFLFWCWQYQNSYEYIQNFINEDTERSTVQAGSICCFMIHTQRTFLQQYWYDSYFVFYIVTHMLQYVNFIIQGQWILTVWTAGIQEQWILSLWTAGLLARLNLRVSSMLPQCLVSWTIHKPWSMVIEVKGVILFMYLFCNNWLQWNCVTL